MRRRLSGQRREVRLLLRFGPEQKDMRGAKPVVGGERQRDRRIDAGDLFDANAVVDRRHRGAAIGLGDLNTEQTETGELWHQLSREMLSLVPLTHMRADFGLREVADRSPQQCLFVARPEVHSEPRRLYHSHSQTRGDESVIGYGRVDEMKTKIRTRFR